MTSKSKISSELQALEALLDDGRPKSRIETLCIQRQIHDLQHGHERGLYWDAHEADRAVRFFSLLKHWKGKCAGRPIDLEPWQSLTWIRPLFGWTLDKPRAAGGLRRFRLGYTEVPRKNGKTLIGAGITLQGLIADDENGAECYTAATTRDQANLVFRDSQKILGKGLRKHVTTWKHSTTCDRWSGTLKPLSGDYGSLDGLNPHRIVYDELHAASTRDLWDVLISALGARQHPLLHAITTAGFNRSSICWEQRESLIQTLEGVEKGEWENDSLFGYISTVDDDDDWQDPLVWAKANPNLGVSLQPAYLKTQCRQAQASPDAVNNFRTKHLDQWTESAVRFLPMERYDAGDEYEPHEAREARLKGRPCLAGLDLGVTRDLSAFVLLFPADDGSFDVLLYCWAPRDSNSTRAEQDRRQLLQWASKGFIRLNDGNEVDGERIRRDIIHLSRHFNIKSLCYDASLATLFIQQLQSDGFPHEKLVTAGRGFSFYNEPTLKLLSLVNTGKLRGGGNPCLRWQLANLAVKRGDNGDMRPSKDKSGNKIDAAVALIYALNGIAEPAAQAPLIFLV